MSEVRSIISGATSRSLVLVDEICRGTETAKGTCIAGSIIEALDSIGCLGIVSTHLHGIFDLPLNTIKTVYKAMETEYINGQPRPTWKLTDGICRESLAFETAQREGVLETIIKRAEELYSSVYAKDSCPQHETKVELSTNDKDNKIFDKAYEQPSSSREKSVCSLVTSTNQMDVLRKEVESAVTKICQKQLLDFYKKKNISELAAVKCVLIAAKEQPPPSTVGASSVYVLLRPDKRLYVGEVLDLYSFLILPTSYVH